MAIQLGDEIIADKIEDIGVPKGSFILGKDINIPVGTIEGLALYINGVELPEEVYQNCNIGVVIDTITTLLDSSGSCYSYWDGAVYTALYFYGDSFDGMKEKIQDFLNEYPLCQKCWVERIA